MRRLADDHRCTAQLSERDEAIQRQLALKFPVVLIEVAPAAAAEGFRAGGGPAQPGTVGIAGQGYFRHQWSATMRLQFKQRACIPCTAQQDEKKHLRGADCQRLHLFRGREVGAQVLGEATRGKVGQRASMTRRCSVGT